MKLTGAIGIVVLVVGSLAMAGCSSKTNEATDQQAAAVAPPPQQCPPPPEVAQPAPQPAVDQGAAQNDQPQPEQPKKRKGKRGKRGMRQQR